MSSLEGQTVVVIGGSAGIGLETGRLAKADGADVILTGRTPERLKQAASDVGAKSTAAFDAKDPAALEGFFAELDEPIDHVLVTAGGPFYGPLDEMDLDEAGDWARDHLLLPLEVARFTKGKIRPGGTLLFIGGTGARRPGRNLTIGSAITNATPGPDREPGNRDRAHPDQPDRARVRRHASVGVAPGRPARRAA